MKALSLLGALIILGIAGAVLAWWSPWTAPEPRDVQPVWLMASGDTAGWIFPCGCTANQSGGLLRRGTRLRQLRERGHVIVVDVGGAPAGSSPYHRVKFEAILKGELAMGVVAHNIGGPEASLGPTYLRGLAANLKVPFLSANVRDAQNKPIAPALLVQKVQGRRIALAGVLSRRFAAPEVHIDDPREALLKVIAEHQGSYDSLVVLAYLPEEELRQLAAQLPEADVVLGGPTGQSMPPKTIGPTLLASATNKGKFLVELEATFQSGSPHWQGQVVELGPDFKDDSEQAANIKEYLADLAKHDFSAQDAGLKLALPEGLPGSYRLAGTAACQKCHQNDCSSWEKSKHAHAWDTLTQSGYHVDSYCQQCHATGFGLPGGFASPRRSAAMVHVGCENCHGPSFAHAQDPSRKTPFAARDQCRQCHDRENSPTFEYTAFWQKISHGDKSR